MFGISSGHLPHTLRATRCMGRRSSDGASEITSDPTLRWVSTDWPTAGPGVVVVPSLRAPCGWLHLALAFIRKWLMFNHHFEHNDHQVSSTRTCRYIGSFTPRSPSFLISSLSSLLTSLLTSLSLTSPPGRGTACHGSPLTHRSNHCT